MSIRIVLAALLATATSWGASYYTVRLDDPKAVYLTPGDFPVRGDGLADDTEAIQQAINKVQETTSQGIVFVPQGRYRLTKTINIWPGIRVIGYGAARPVFLLAGNTPGYQDKDNERYMIFFAGGRPGAGRGFGGGRGAAGGRGAPGAQPPAGRAGRGAPDGQPPDASPGTFYSAISNIDLEIGDGNPGAVGVRARYAQHCFMAHMDFRIGSGLAGIHEAGNVGEDLHFYGGQYAIWTRRPSPGWQYTVVDASFEGQREAAIREREAGLTLIRPHFRNVPTAISIDEGFPDELWVKNGRMEDITGPAVIVSLEKNARTEINLENIVCQRVPVFASFRESGKKVAAPSGIYEVKVFSHGLSYSDIGAVPAIRDVFEATPLPVMPAPFVSDLPDLPPRDSWVNIRALGAKGDGATDDTAVFKKAIAENHAIYLPSGKYVVGDTIVLKPDTVLIGLHPSATQIDLLDSTPAFQGVGAPEPLIEAPQGGTNIMIGIGLYTNGVNPRAVAAKWMAGKDSMMNDVRFLGGHGTNRLDGTRENPYNNTHTADPDLNRRWDSQYPSLWVTAGGGGTFFDIWTPSTFAQAGMLVSDTTTEGRVYQMSSEHHVRYEIQIHHASNWQIYALQTEEERGEGGFALPLEIDGSSNITLANFHIYRVISTFQPFPWAIKISNSRNIRLRNIHCYSNSKVSFDDAVYDQTHNVEIRQREFAWLTLSGNAPQVRPKPASPVLAAGARVEKLAGGFYNISGGAVDPAGDFYFVDAKWQRIYRWSAALRRTSIVRDSPLDPVSLAFDKAGNLIVVGYSGNGTVYAFKPGAEGEVSILKPEPFTPRPVMTAVLPVGDYHLQSVPRSYQYVSPDGTTFISAGQDFVNGSLMWGVKGSDVLRAFGLARAVPGKPYYLTDESELTTWSATVGPDGNLTDQKLFADQGGEGVAVDERGNVYIAAGQIYVYDPAGKLIDTIEVPERPLQLVFGGKDGQTLFIPARTSLYAVRTRIRGR
ncbi:MAG TPA: glycosyl hydrolase family 28-related protein [Bryobacteraceae bacterium]|nr:glycosyl hydrolase family 28-related protein [Bryobacteraceae bacterium]